MAGSQKSILAHLESDYTEPIRDPLWKHIYVSKDLETIIQTELFQKLSGIKQLGPTYLLYPGATHNRLSHSLGVFHIARQIMIRLVRRSSLSGLSLSGVKAYLYAALLHDLGHYPFAHSLKELDVENHEVLTARLILSDGFKGVIGEKGGIDPVLIAAIIDHKLKYTGDEDIRFYRSLLSGVLDPDKLDYLNRDAYYCGVPYGIQDVDYILNEIYPHKEKGIAITFRGLTSIESILFSKYLMYKTVYWHKTVRIATSMIKKAVFLALNEKIISAENLYGLSDQAFFNLLSRSGFEPFKMAFGVSNGNLYTMLARVAFDERNPFHKKLEGMASRAEFEKKIAEYLSRETGKSFTYLDIVIDIPERISFESDLPVYYPEKDEMAPFHTAGSVFNEPVVQKFTSSLRFILVSARVDERSLSVISNLDLGKILTSGYF